MEPLSTKKDNIEKVCIPKLGKTYSVFQTDSHFGKYCHRTLFKKQSFVVPRGDFRTYHGRFTVRNSKCVSCGYLNYFEPDPLFICYQCGREVEARFAEEIEAKKRGLI